MSKKIAIIGGGVGAHTAISAAIQAIHKFEKVEIVNFNDDQIDIQARVKELNSEITILAPPLPYCPPLSRRERRKLKRKSK